MDLEILKPAQWPRPSGYSNGIAVTGRPCARLGSARGGGRHGTRLLPRVVDRRDVFRCRIHVAEVLADHPADVRLSD